MAVDDDLHAALAMSMQDVRAAAAGSHAAPRPSSRHSRTHAHTCALRARRAPRALVSPPTSAACTRCLAWCPTRAALRTAGTTLAGCGRRAVRACMAAHHCGAACDALVRAAAGADKWMCYDDDTVAACTTDDVMKLNGGGAARCPPPMSARWPAVSVSRARRHAPRMQAITTWPTSCSTATRSSVRRRGRGRNAVHEQPSAARMLGLANTALCTMPHAHTAFLLSHARGA